MKTLRNNKKAQALLELAIFGTIIIMLLGVLLNYGLRYNAQQRVEQKAFRRAMNEAYSLDFNVPLNGFIEAWGGHNGMGFLDYIRPRGTGSYAVVEDIHLPDPANPWGVGPVVPVAASASVTRDERSDSTPDFPRELPQMVVEINGKQEVYRTAGERVTFTTNAAFEKRVYNGGVWLPASQLVDDVAKNFGSSVGPAVIIDPSDGEILDYDSACRQCRLMYSQTAVLLECLKEFGPQTIENMGDSDEGYRQEILSCINALPVAKPWYCEGGYPVNEDGTMANPVFDNIAGRWIWPGAWVFPKLFNPEAETDPGAPKGIFNGAGYTGVDSRVLGVQPTPRQTVINRNKIKKEETPEDITTTSIIDSRTIIERKTLTVERPKTSPLDFMGIWEAIGPGRWFGGRERPVVEGQQTSTVIIQGESQWQTPRQ